MKRQDDSSAEKQAEIIGDEIAVVCGNETLTYAQLNRRANQLVRTFIEKGLSPTDRRHHDSAFC